MAIGIHHTIIVSTKPSGSGHVVGELTRNWFSYQHATLYTQHERVTLGDEVFHVLSEFAKPLSYTQCLSLAVAARSGREITIDLRGI